MARFYYVGESYEELTFEEARARNLSWDVFVSHTTKDDEFADEVARCIRTFGLTAWVDSDFMSSNDDGPEMAAKIKLLDLHSACWPL